MSALTGSAGISSSSCKNFFVLYKNYNASDVGLVAASGFPDQPWTVLQPPRDAHLGHLEPIRLGVTLFDLWLYRFQHDLLSFIP